MSTMKLFAYRLIRMIGRGGRRGLRQQRNHRRTDSAEQWEVALGLLSRITSQIPSRLRAAFL
jgi:hypothetical protein